jgi:hypothetical protein
MWIRINHARVSNNHVYTLHYIQAGAVGPEPASRAARGAITSVIKAAQALSNSLQQDVRISGRDSEGEFTLGVFTGAGQDAADSGTSLLRELYAASVQNSITVADRLLLEFDPNMIRGFAVLCSMRHQPNAGRRASQGISPKLSASTTLPRKWVGRRHAVLSAAIHA